MRPCAILLLCAGLGACTPSPGPPLGAYIQALAQRLEVDYSPHAVAVVPMPDMDNIRPRTITPMTISLTQLNQLRHCQLNSLIAIGNTPLGHMQSHFSRYLHQTQLLQAIEQCLALPETAKARDWLLALYQSKQRLHADYYANLLIGGKEVRLAFTFSGARLELIDDEQMQAFFHAFDYLLTLQSQPQVASQTLATALKVIGEIRLPARLWAAQHSLLAQLTSLTRWLEGLSLTRYCQTPARLFRLKAAYQAYQAFNQDTIIPTMARLHDIHMALGPRMQRFTNQLPRVQEWQQRVVIPQALLQQRLAHALAQHHEYWRRLRETCNI